MLLRGILLFLFVVSAPSLADARLWHDNQGHALNAEFLNFKNGVVYLSHARKTVQLPFETLCADDQDYVRELLKAQGKSSLLPAPNPKVEPAPADGLAPGTMAERTWTDQAGKTALGRFLGVSHGSVHLQVHGRENAVPYARFCDDDRQYVRDVLAGKIAAQPASAPVPAAKPPVVARMPPARPVRPTKIEIPRVASSVAGQPPQQPQMPAVANPWPAMPTPSIAQQRLPASPGPPVALPLQPTVVHRCSNCQAILPATFKAGSNCPHCGVYFSCEKDVQGNVVGSAPYWNNPYFLGTGGTAFLIGLAISLARWFHRS